MTIALEITARDGAARTGVAEVRGRRFHTPAFMPVGTVGSVKGLSPRDLRQLSVEIILSNTYHLRLRPGPDRVREFGGLHAFCGWDGAILTDSGGYQIFSHTDRVRVDEDGATFKSHLDGEVVRLTPEEAVRIQDALDPDVAMVLDHPVALPSPESRVEAAARRSLRWAERCLRHHRETVTSGQALFAILQGATDPELRKRQAEDLRALAFDGYAVGGLATGESKGELAETMRLAVPLLPDDRPRYVMGIGYPDDLLRGIAAGADMFDCVVPTRHARTGQAFTSSGVVRLKHKVRRAARGPLDPRCSCETCRDFEVGYLTHLYKCREMLGPTLVARHNVHFYQRLVGGAREAIAAGTVAAYQEEFLARYAGGAPSGAAE
ncbi:MAG: tRNA guanosine(34) transglycosylase Tgt [Planctomycetota bacterium JB042]